MPDNKTPQINLDRLREIVKEELNEVRGSAFKEGDRVRSNVDAQGMKKGNVYDVVDVESRHTPFGVFMTYQVVDPKTGVQLTVRNAHLLLSRVNEGMNEQVDHAAIKDIVTGASKLLAAVEAFKKSAGPAATNAVTPHLGALEKTLEDMVGTPGSYVSKPKVEPKKVSLRAVKGES
jgi:hypothetical protein